VYPKTAVHFVLEKAWFLPYRVNRVVVGYHELVEKLLLWRDGLDDRVIEYLKYASMISIAPPQERRLCFLAGVPKQN